MWGQTPNSELEDSENLKSFPVPTSESVPTSPPPSSNSRE